jgi:hypothetical protein
MLRKSAPNLMAWLRRFHQTSQGPGVSDVPGGILAQAEVMEKLYLPKNARERGRERCRKTQRGLKPALHRRDPRTGTG